jgi:probable O-glycosylation ligase (exosortase A-associated)
MGLALNMTLPIYYFLAVSEAKKWMKWVFGSLFIMTIPVIFSTWSRGAMVGLVTVFCSLLTFVSLKQRLILIPVVATGIAVALVFAPEAWRQRMDPTRENAIDTSAQARLNVWQFSRNLAADYPIAGGGFMTFTPELFTLYGPPGQRAMAPHSVYFQLLAEHGFVGLGIYLWMLGSFFLTARKLVKEARNRGDDTVRQYSKMLQFAVVGFATSGLFLGRAYFDYLFFIVACQIILKRVAADEWSQEDVVAEQPQTEEEAAFEASV